MAALLTGLALFAGLPAWAERAVTEVNRANLAELEMVKGVGPQLSGQLLQARAERPFQDWPDLIRRLKGVGPARAALLSSHGLRVNGQGYEGATPADGPSASTPSR